MQRSSLWSTALLVLALPTAQADTVTAKLHFENILPLTGIVYLPDPTADGVSATLDQQDKQFVKAVAVVGPDSELRIRNSDDFQHNIYADDKRTGTAFDLGMIEPRETFRLPVRWTTDTLLHLGCKIHPKMKAYVANIRSRNYATVDFAPDRKDYQVTLPDVAANLHEVRILLPDMTPMSATLKAGQTLQIPVVVRERNVGSIELARRKE